MCYSAFLEMFYIKNGFLKNTWLSGKIDEESNGSETFHSELEENL